MKNALISAQVFETRFLGESDLAYTSYETHRDAVVDRTL